MPCIKNGSTQKLAVDSFFSLHIKYQRTTMNERGGWIFEKWQRWMYADPMIVSFSSLWIFVVFVCVCACESESLNMYWVSLRWYVYMSVIEMRESILNCVCVCFRFILWAKSLLSATQSLSLSICCFNWRSVANWIYLPRKMNDSYSTWSWRTQKHTWMLYDGKKSSMQYYYRSYNANEENIIILFFQNFVSLEEMNA